MSRKEKKTPKLPVTDSGDEVDFSPQRKFVVKRTGKQIARMQRSIKATTVAVIILILLVLLLYFLFYFIDKGNRSGEGENIDMGDFTVQIDPGDRSLISLSEHEDLSEPAVLLQGTSVDNMWHCTRSWIPEDVDANSKGGDASSQDPSYLCYTFYVMNASKKEITYRYDLDFVEKQLDTDEAIRIMVYRNGDPAIYGKKSKDGTPLEEGTKTFVSDITYIAATDLKMAENAVDKYTVVMWFEGEDPECVNEILTGKLKVEMNFYTENSPNY